jgi:hypothetical protein
VWVALGNGRLAAYREGALETIATTADLPGGLASLEAMGLDAQGRPVVAIAGAGLYRWEPAGWQRATSAWFGEQTVALPRGAAATHAVSVTSLVLSRDRAILGTSGSGVIVWSFAANTARALPLVRPSALRRAPEDAGLPRQR